MSEISESLVLAFLFGMLTTVIIVRVIIRMVDRKYDKKLKKLGGYLNGKD